MFELPSGKVSLFEEVLNMCEGEKSNVDLEISLGTDLPKNCIER